jgi:hypothetical protein
MRLATADLKSRDLMDDGQRRNRQSTIEMMIIFKFSACW